MGERKEKRERERKKERGRTQNKDKQFPIRRQPLISVDDIVVTSLSGKCSKSGLFVHSFLISCPKVN